MDLIRTDVDTYATMAAPAPEGSFEERMESLLPLDLPVAPSPAPAAFTPPVFNCGHPNVLENRAREEDAEKRASVQQGEPFTTASRQRSLRGGTALFSTFSRSAGSLSTRLGTGSGAIPSMSSHSDRLYNGKTRSTTRPEEATAFDLDPLKLNTRGPPIFGKGAIPLRRRSVSALTEKEASLERS
jgi:hypothetical protein